MKAFRTVVTLFLLIGPAITVFAEDQKADELYKTRCQGCHGPAGRASIVGKKLGAKDFQDPDVIKMPRAEVEKIIATGKNKMPSYKDTLAANEIKALAKYIREMK